MPRLQLLFLHKSKRCTQTINNKMGKWLSCYPENASLALTDCQVVFQNKKRTVLSWSDTATRLLPSCSVTKIHKKQCCLSFKNCFKNHLWKHFCGGGVGFFSATSSTKYDRLSVKKDANRRGHVFVSSVAAFIP